MSQTNHKGYTRKQVTELTNDYILGCIYTPEQWAGDYGVQANTDAERINAVWGEFQSWYHGFHKKQYPNIQVAFAEWLTRMPGVIEVDQWYDEIAKILINWGVMPENPTDAMYTRMTQNWYSSISFRFLRLREKLNRG